MVNFTVSISYVQDSLQNVQFVWTKVFIHDCVKNNKLPENTSRSLRQCVFQDIIHKEQQLVYFALEMIWNKIC